MKTMFFNRRKADRGKSQRKSSRLMDIATLLPSVFGFVLFILMLCNFIYWWPLTPDFRVLDPAAHVATYRSSVLRVHAAYCVSSDMPVKISRDLVSVTGPELRINLPQTVQVYQDGCIVTDRLFEVPKFVPSGDYRLVSIATWRANPFRDAVARLPDLPVTIDSR